MKLRNLELKDASRMLRWMHNPEVVKHLGTDFSEKTLGDCIGFINASLQDNKNLHLAVTNDFDIYMGTVSLKHIDTADKTAEFAITVSADAMGKGYAKFGMQTILDKGIEELDLKSIYWCVSSCNKRAVKFYDKYGYRRTDNVPDKILSLYENSKDLIWYIYTGK